jgi:hypothetical protein
MVSVDEICGAVVSRTDVLMTPPFSKLTADAARELEVRALGLG